MQNIVHVVGDDCQCVGRPFDPKITNNIEKKWTSHENIVKNNLDMKLI